jgi:hypothetical protein
MGIPSRWASLIGLAAAPLVMGCAGRFDVAGTPSSTDVRYVAPSNRSTLTALGQDPRWGGGRVLVVDASGAAGSRVPFERANALLESSLLELGRTPIVGHTAAFSAGCAAHAHDAVELAHCLGDRAQADLVLQIVAWPEKGGRLLVARYVHVASGDVLATVFVEATIGQSSVQRRFGVGSAEFAKACLAVRGSVVSSTHCDIERPSPGTAWIVAGGASAAVGLGGVADGATTLGGLLLLTGGVAIVYGVIENHSQLAKDIASLRTQLPAFAESAKPPDQTGETTVLGAESSALVSALVAPLAKRGTP